MLCVVYFLTHFLLDMEKSLQGCLGLNVSPWVKKMFVLYITGECYMLGVSSSGEPAVSPFPTALKGK